MQMASNSFRDWMGGLISAIAGGFSATTGATMVDPSFTWLTPAGRQKMLVVGGMAAWPAVIAYLQKRPLPGVVEQTDVVVNRSTAGGEITTTMATHTTTTTQPAPLPSTPAPPPPPAAPSAPSGPSVGPGDRP